MAIFNHRVQKRNRPGMAWWLHAHTRREGGRWKSPPGPMPSWGRWPREERSTLGCSWRTFLTCKLLHLNLCAPLSLWRAEGCGVAPGKGFLPISLPIRKQLFGILPVTSTWAEEMPDTFCMTALEDGLCSCQETLPAVLLGPEFTQTCHSALQ